jgi:glycerol-3-phosphate dehydrogenase
MAEDTLNFAIKQGTLPRRKCITDGIPLHGATKDLTVTDPYLREYGTDIPAIEALIASDPQLGETIDPDLPYTFAQVVYAVREERARTLEDVLPRRTRALLLDAAAAIRSAPKVAAVVAKELGQSSQWQQAQIEAFTQLARTDYMLATESAQQ